MFNQDKATLSIAGELLLSWAIRLLIKIKGTALILSRTPQPLKVTTPYIVDKRPTI
ncbi:hypothetical protein DSUL_40066 [Desulfovibrionales bacterium]